MSIARGGKGFSRTRWAELRVEDMVAPAFVSEFVFRSLQIIDRGRAREVADLLITRGDQALLISQKCQEEPGTRSSDKAKAWARKQADSAAAQLKGALRRVGIANEIWCDHPRRGRVPFPNGLPPITHALALVEAFELTELGDDAASESHGTPITYLAVSDFLNLVLQLRTVPELVRYLDARRALPASEQRIIGSEQVLFLYYLLRDGSFAGFNSYEDAEGILADHAAELHAVMTAKAERDLFSMQIEYVADQLAGRHELFAEGLSPAVLAYYEPVGERRAYLQMQEILAGMHLAERASIGQAFQGTIEQRKACGGGFGHRAALVSSLPDVVLILGSFAETSSFTRDALLSILKPLADQAMLHYERSRCLIIVDRDGKSFDVALGAVTGPSPSGLERTESKHFASLKTTYHEVGLRPT